MSEFPISQAHLLDTEKRDQLIKHLISHKEYSLARTLGAQRTHIPERGPSELGSQLTNKTGSYLVSQDDDEPQLPQMGEARGQSGMRILDEGHAEEGLNLLDKFESCRLESNQTKR